MTNLDDKIEIMMWKKHHTNSRICKRKEKKKARITQLKTYKYEGILSKGIEEGQYLQGRTEDIQGRDRRSTRRRRRLEEVRRRLVEESEKKERLFC